MNTVVTPDIAIVFHTQEPDESDPLLCYDVLAQEEQVDMIKDKLRTYNSKCRVATHSAELLTKLLRDKFVVIGSEDLSHSMDKKSHLEDFLEDFIEMQKEGVNCRIYKYDHADGTLYQITPGVLRNSVQ